MAWKVMISAPYMQPVVDRFRHIFNDHNIEIIIPPVDERMEEDQLLEYMGDIDGVICGDDKFTEKVLESSPKLKVLSKWGTGIDSIDQAFCKKQGIEIRRTPNAFSEPVGDTVLGYMLTFSRNIPWVDKEMKKGNWEKIPCRALRECTLGVIGVGDTGKAVVRRAKCFGMHIIGNDIVDVSEDFIDETGIEMAGKEQLLQEADFISLNCDLNPTSYHLVSYNEFKLMKDTAIIINAGRGPVLDEAALIDALQNNKVAGAALDVFENEPLPHDNPLLKMENVILSPHNANSSPEAWENVHMKTINNLIEVLELSRT